MLERQISCKGERILHPPSIRCIALLICNLPLICLYASESGAKKRETTVKKSGKCGYLLRTLRLGMVTSLLAEMR